MTFDPTKPCQTRDGRPVIIVKTDWPGPYPIIGLIGERTQPVLWAPDGRYLCRNGGKETDIDLINLPSTPTIRWVLIKKDQSSVWQRVYASEKDASAAKNHFHDPPEWTVAKIEWEE